MLIDPISSALSVLDNFAILGEKLSPAIIEWIDQQVKLSAGCIAQRKLTRRVRHCKRHCRRGRYGAAQIETIVSLDFIDMTTTQRQEITSLLDYELLKPKG